jgi:hypothetical protein
LGDWPISGERIDTHVHSDVDENIYEIERDFPDSHSLVRKVNQLVVGLGETEGVKTYIVPPPLICTSHLIQSNHSPTLRVLEPPKLLDLLEYIHFAKLFSRPRNRLIYAGRWSSPHDDAVVTEEETISHDWGRLWGISFGFFRFSDLC